MGCYFVFVRLSSITGHMHVEMPGDGKAHWWSTLWKTVWMVSKTWVIISCSNPTSEHILGIGVRILKRDAHIHVYGLMSHCCPKVETIHRCTDKKYVVRDTRRSYLASVEEEALLSVTLWMNLENTMLSEIIQAVVQMLCDVTSLRNLLFYRACGIWVWNCGYQAYIKGKTEEGKQWV